MGTSTGVRRANLSRLLRLVHVDGPVSRSELTATTGLNRATIGDLVAELAAAGLVQEHDPHPAKRVGRPSPLVAGHPDVVAIGVNPEVDALTMAAIGLDRRIRVRVRHPHETPPGPDEVVALVSAQIAAWGHEELAGARIVAIGAAVPGLVRADDGVVREAPHLGWRDCAFRDLLQEASGLPVAVGNDATLGAQAEHLFGAARGIADVVYLNGGASGIGGGLVVHGIVVSGAGGFAGEFGQNRPGIIDARDRRAPDGVLEDEVSRARLLDALGLGAADDPTLAAHLAASDGDAVAQEVARQRRILATALGNAVNVLNPSVVVLGGFLALLAEDRADDTQAGTLLEDVRAQAMSASASGLALLPAALGDDRLLIGAAEVAFEGLLDDPLPG